MKLLDDDIYNDGYDLPLYFDILFKLLVLYRLLGDIFPELLILPWQYAMVETI